jgi:transcriptional regulator with XRE-family HTH domain
MAINTERLQELAKPRNERAQRRSQERRENRAWLTFSQDIALALHYYMREKEMTQRELASKMGVSPVYIVRLLKGGENLTLDTICKLQDALGENLFNVARPYELARIIKLATPYSASDDVEFSRIYSKDISGKNKYQRVNVRMVAY